MLARGASLAAALCGLWIAACGPGAQNPHCSSGSQCAKGLVCKASECVAPNQCPSTQASCSSNSSCSAGTSCQGGCCAPLEAGSCRSSADCTDPGAPHCDTGACRACAGNSECTAGLICTPTGACLTGCDKDANCPAGDHCFTSNNGNWCGECALSTDCADPLKPTCSGGVCTGCASDDDCSGTAPACDTSTHKCVACIDSANGSDGKNARCTGAAKACVKEVCVTCAPLKNDSASGVNGACPAASPVCDTNKTCIACADSYNGGGDVNGACPGTIPACLNKSCLPCVTALNNATTGVNAACLAPTPVCNTANAGCVGCLADAHCPVTAYCSPGKTCVKPALTDLTPHGITLNPLQTTPMTVTLDHAPRADTPVAVSLTGEGSLDAATATVLAGQTAAVFHYTAPAAVPATNPVTVSASLGGVVKQAHVTITDAPPALDTVTPANASVQAGQKVKLTVNMTVAVAADTPITLGSAAGGSVPVSVTVLSGTATADFFFTAGTAPAAGVVVTASYLGVNKTASVDVTALNVLSVTPPTPSVMKTATTQLTVTLTSNAVSDVVVALASEVAYGTVPATVTVLAGTSAANFLFTAVEVTPTTTAVTATLNGASQHADVTVTTNLFHVGGTVTGLVGSVTLQNNTANDLAVGADGTFQFTGTVASGAPYAVTVSSDPTLEKCHVTANGSGPMPASDVTSVVVTCGLKVMVARVGDGTTAVTTGPALAAFVDEYDTVNGAVIRTINMPTAVSGSNSPLTLSSSSIEGGLSRSGDGKYVVLGGYAAVPGTTGVVATVSTGATPTDRVVARVSAGGTVDTSTLLYGAFSGVNIRGAATADGTAFWASGSSGGIWYATLGANAQTPAGTTTQIASTPSNARDSAVYAGQLYESSGSNPTQGVVAVGTGLPAAAATATLLNGFPTSATGCTVCNAEAFAVLDTDGTGGIDTIYETVNAASTTANSINVAKWVLDTSGTPIWKQPATAWLPLWNGTPALTAGARGLAAYVMPNGKVRVFITTGGGDSGSHLMTFLDDGNSPAVSLIATSPAGTSATFFRGVAVSPAP